MTIEVAQRHIDEGYRRNCWKCPISLAILDRVRAGVRVAVSSFRVDFMNDSFEDQLEPPGSLVLPNEVRWFVMDYDHNLPVKPFSFELDIPKEVL